MTEKNLLGRLEAYLDLNAQRRKKKADELKAIIGKLKKKEKALIAEYQKAGKGKKGERLEKRCVILPAQRKMGRKALKKNKQKKNGDSVTVMHDNVMIANASAVSILLACPCQ
jgi:hypothetical protein